MGPLRVAPGGYYFEAPDGQPVYLAGSHNWTLQQDWIDPGPGPLDFTVFLDFMVKNEHINFIRDWMQEHTENPDSTYRETFTVTPMPWARSGQCCAKDGKNLFDLSRFDDAKNGYFDRLSHRVRAAYARGIYISVMLFVGNWDADPNYGLWNYNPWNSANHIRANHANPANGYAVENLGNPNITRLQNAYVCHVVRKIGSFPNVLYEIANEAGEKLSDAGNYSDLQNNLRWQEAMVTQVHACEKKYGYARHPVGITSLSDSGGSRQSNQEKATTNAWLLTSTADWIAPGGNQYQHSDYKANGQKVVMMDTDHIFGGGGDANWVWGQFISGNNVLVMDNLAGTGIKGAENLDANPGYSLAKEANTRLGINETRQAASLLSWNGVVPHPELSPDTNYCLSDKANQYIVYDPNGGQFHVNLSGASGSLYVTWIDVASGTVTTGGTVSPAGSKSYLFIPPGKDAMALVLSPADWSGTFTFTK